MIVILFKIKIAFVTILFWVVFLLGGIVFAQKTSLEESNFTKAIDGILTRPCLRGKNFGIKIQSLDRSETLYSVRSDRLFVPASNIKLLTTAMALKKMRPNYRFKTTLHSTMKITDENLDGDLYIKGFGDPNLVSEQMWLLVNALKNLSLRKISGDIVADDSFFDERRRVKTWNKKNGVEAYNAPLGALSFNFNTVTVYVSPGEKLGDRPIVTVDPDIDFVRVVNRAKTVSQSRRSRIIVNRLGQRNHNEVTVSGRISVNNPR